ncbi:MAG TPA: RpiB/LacA/LacB family sugar-phosphate isomerase, partial [Segetibacter sp.]
WQKEVAEMARRHNNANILCLPARFVSLVDAVEIINIFLTTPFDGGRHEGRVNKIACS